MVSSCSSFSQLKGEGTFPGKEKTKMKELKVFVYCRVMDSQASDLLDYQEKELTELLGYLDAKVFGVVKEVSSGKNFCSYGLQKLIHYIINQKIDVIAVYDDTRLAIYDDLRAEFQMICDKYDVDIVDVSDLTTMIFTNSILKSRDM